MSKPNVPGWLERELSRQLGAAQAPEVLWNRIQTASQAPPVEAMPWSRWAIAAILILAAAAGTFWLPGRIRVPALHAVAVSAGSANQPTDWDLPCAPPASHSTYRLAGFSNGYFPIYAAVSSPRPPENGSCQSCHGSIAN